MRVLSRAVLAAALLISAATATPAAAQVQVTLRPLAGVEAIYLADFLPGGSGLRPDLIGITLVNPERASQPVSLELVVARETPSPAEIFRGTSEPFALRETVRHLTFRDLVTEGRDAAITDYEVNDEVLDDGSLRTGRFPAGTYLFTVRLRTAQGTPLDQDELRITLSHPSRVEPLAPGAPADAPPPTLPDATPRFVWSTDGQAGAQYRLRVVRVDDAASAVEAVQGGFPVWETVTNATSVFYPASVEAVRLEPGATYAWQVTRELRTTGGVEPVESPVYWFRVGGAGARTAAGGLDPRFAALLRALGLAGELDGFTPVGATLEDGRVLPLHVLEELLAAIEAGEVPVLSVRVR